MLLLPLLFSCTKIELIDSENLVEKSPVDVSDFFSFEYDSLGFVMSNDVLERAYQMATLEWTPVNPVPMNGGKFYPKGRTVTGVPYSSVKEINTYLFQDVSYHTFMTAVYNPRSVLYTEDVSKTPYHGKNCASYYGAVCSSAVMFAFGINIPYYANQIIRLPYMDRLEYQVIDSLKVCDVIWKNGHVQMIYEIEHRADTLYRITTFESSGISAHLSDYSKEQFLKMWNKERYVGYRNNHLKYSEDIVEFKMLPPVNHNEDLCPSKGDRSVYRTTDVVTINIFNPYYTRIVLTNGLTNEIVSETIRGEDHTFYGLKPGIYFVSLQKGESKSETVSFEIVETNVDYSDGDEGDGITVYFHSSAKPEYVALCTLWGSSSYYPISSDECERGYISIPRMNTSEYYCKIVFKGEYGRIINEPIRVQ